MSSFSYYCFLLFFFYVVTLRGQPSFESSNPGCTCVQDVTFSPTLNQCIGTYQAFVGDTQFYLGQWTPCTNTTFSANFNVPSSPDTQYIYIPSVGVLTVQGNLSLHASFNNSIQIQGQDPLNQGTFEIFGDLIIDGNVNFTIADLYVDGNIYITQAGNLTISVTNQMVIKGNITANGSITVEGYTNASISVGGFIVAEQEIFIERMVGTIGSINSPSAQLDIGGVTQTSISTKSVQIASIILSIDNEDKGTGYYGVPFSVLRSSTPFTAPVFFEQDWVCGDYRVIPSVSMNTSVIVTLSGASLNVTSPQYCCVEGVDPCICAPYTGVILPQCIPVCNGWMCSVEGFIIGWVVGALLLLPIFIVACRLLSLDFIESVE